MTIRTRGFVLLVIQSVLVLSAAAKYEWERHTRPMVWARAQPFGLSAEHESTMSGEGRYGRLQLQANACGLPTAKAVNEPEYQGITEFEKQPSKWHKILKDNVRTIVRNGSLIAVDAGEIKAADVQEIYWDMRRPCTEAKLLNIVEVYLPQGMQTPYTVKPGETLWVLVTVPKSGPPRPVQLATSDTTGFHPWARK
jgi:hypothetical protein